MADDIRDSWTEAPSSGSAGPAPARRRRGLGRRGAVAAAFAGLTTGGFIGGLAVTHAAGGGAMASAPTGATAVDPATGLGTVQAAANPTASANPGAQDEDLQVVAGVIGISVGELQSELSGGRTIAQVAQAHNVGADKVISAWTDSENAEIDARVKSGQLTQAQADPQRTTTRQRVTDEVNGTRHGPGGDPGGPRHRGPGGGPAGPGAGA